MLSEADLKSAKLVRTDFNFTDLRRANLRSATLEKAKLNRASLVDANAEKANFARSKLTGRVSPASLRKALPSSMPNFSRASLTGANFEKAELGRASFGGAKLKRTRFTRANLSRTDLSGIIIEGPIAFDGSVLFLTRIESVDLSAGAGRFDMRRLRDKASAWTLRTGKMAL